MSFESDFIQIQDVCTRVCSGGTPSTRNKDFYIDGTVPWVKTKEVNNSKIFEAETYITEAALTKSSAKLIPKNCVIVAMYGNGDTAGRVAINKLPVATNQACCNLIIDPSKADYRFVFYYLRTQYSKLVDLKNGGAQQNLNGKLLKEYPLPNVELGLQIQIADFLEQLDDKILLNAETNQTLEQMAQAIFKSWFVDFDPVKAKMNGEQPEGMDAATASLFPEKLVESELGLIPDGWNIESIKDFGDVICGKTPSKKNADFYAGDVPFIKIPDTHGKVFITETSDTLTQAGDESQPKKRIPENSICVSCIATVGQVFITTKPSHTNQQINSVVPYDQNSLYYLLFKFKGLNKHFHDLASGGSATLNMNTSTFSKVALVRPTSDVLEAFHKTVGGLMEKMLANQLENATLSKLRDTLLPKLLSGEIELDTTINN